jgi:hypothetical protein
MAWQLIVDSSRNWSDEVSLFIPTFAGPTADRTGGQAVRIRRFVAVVAVV